MNNSTDLNKAKQKKVGRVAILSFMINGMIAKGDQSYALGLMAEKNMLLSNGNKPPIPARILNQRQQRKRARQNPHLRK